MGLRDKIQERYVYWQRNYVISRLFIKRLHAGSASGYSKSLYEIAHSLVEAYKRVREAEAEVRQAESQGDKAETEAYITELENTFKRIEENLVMFEGDEAKIEDDEMEHVNLIIKNLDLVLKNLKSEHITDEGRKNIQSILNYFKAVKLSFRQNVEAHISLVRRFLGQARGEPDWKKIEERIEALQRESTEMAGIIQELERDMKAIIDVSSRILTSLNINHQKRAATNTPGAIPPDLNADINVIIKLCQSYAETIKRFEKVSDQVFQNMLGIINDIRTMALFLLNQYGNELEKKGFPVKEYDEFKDKITKDEEKFFKAIIRVIINQERVVDRERGAE